MKKPDLERPSCRKPQYLSISSGTKLLHRAIVVEHLEERFQAQDVAVGFAFLRYTEPHTAMEVLLALLRQFTQAHDGVLSVIRPIYERITAKEGAKLNESDILTILREIASFLSNVYVVLDGLDEASDEVKDRLLPVLASSGVNLLILSRPLEMYTYHTPDATCLFIQARTDDIGLYVEDQVRGSARLQSILRGRPELVKLLCDRVKEKSDGM